MRKIEDSFIIKNASDALRAVRDGDFEVEKTAMNINVGPATLIGALTGATIAVNKKKKKSDFATEYNQIRNTAPRIEKPSVINGYYSQVEAIAKNLKVVFTPLSVIYIVKHNLKYIPIETINTDAMDNTMYDAWKNKNEDFFKNMLINKMRIEISFAEKMFAKNVLDSQRTITNHVLKRKDSMKKRAYTDGTLEFMEKTAEFKDIYSSLAKDTREKMASMLCEMCDNGDCVEITWGFDGEAEKYASLGRVNDVFGANFSSDRIRDLEKKLSRAGYLKRNVDIGFLPDKVVYIVDNTVISTFPVLNMNKESFDAFKQQDKVYFNRAFAREIERGKKVLDKKAFEESNDVLSGSEKTAASRLISAPKATVFRMSGIAPRIYYMILKKQYSYRWNEIDMAALIKMIEQDFRLDTTGISDIPLNKIMSICTCLSEETVNAFSSPLAFEKIIRSFNDLPINFLASEKDTITVNELVYGLLCYAEIMNERGKNAYSLFSDEIKSYIADLLLEKDTVVLYPGNIDSEPAMEFYGDINSLILRRLVEKNNLNADSMDSEEYRSAVQNEILQPLTVDILTEMRDNNINEEALSDMIEELAKSNEFDMSKEALLRRQVRINIEVDKYIKSKTDLANAQLALYNLE